SVSSVTGSVGSVTGNVGGNVVGSVGSVTARVTANTDQFGGTAVTGRDIGASVLLSPGTGTGQVDITAGVVKTNLVQILGTALTETIAGNIAAAFKKLLDVATAVATVATQWPDAAHYTNGNGDNLAKLDANVSTR